MLPLLRRRLPSRWADDLAEPGYRAPAVLYFSAPAGLARRTGRL